MIRKNNLNQKAQVTIFIIFALIIVVVIVLLFILMRPKDFQVEDVENPQAYIDSCVRDFTEEAISILSEQGGDIVPSGATQFENLNISYVCYSASWYEPCIMQRPDLVKHIEKEITDYISPKTESCFDALKQKLESKGYLVELGDMNLDTTLQTGKVIVNINRYFKMTKREETRAFDNFKIGIDSPINELAEVAMEIANQEARFCNFDILSYMIYYPQYDLSKFRPGNGDVVYYIRHIQTNQRFVTATRSCALPPGF